MLWRDCREQSFSAIYLPALFSSVTRGGQEGTWNHLAFPWSPHPGSVSMPGAPKQSLAAALRATGGEDRAGSGWSSSSPRDWLLPPLILRTVCPPCTLGTSVSPRFQNTLPPLPTLGIPFLPQLFHRFALGANSAYYLTAIRQWFS